MALPSVLAICALLPYLNTLRNGFVYDDTTQVLANPYIRNFHHLREILTTTVWSYRGGVAGITSYYRPLMLLSYLLCFRLAGPQAMVFHLANVLFHAAVVFVLFQLTEPMFKDRALAFGSAAAFALHPIHSEPVEWIAAVTDLELAFFYLLTFWIFLGLSKPGVRRPRLAQFGMAGSFALALFSKEPAVTLPLLATIYEHFYRQDRTQTGWKQKVSRYGALWVLDILYVLFRLRFLGAFAPGETTRNLTFDEVALSGLALLGQYLWKFLWPVHLSAFYVFPNDLAELLGLIPVGLLVLPVLGLLSFALWRRAPLISFGFLWFLVTLAPVLNVRWMPLNAFSERYLYLPSVGLCWALGWGCARLFEITAGRGAVWRRGLVAVLAVLATLCVIRVVERNGDWHDEMTFCTRTLAASPNAYTIRNNLGLVYFEGGDLQAAEREWLAAEKIAPAYPTLLNNLGLLYTEEERYEEAVDILQENLRRTPNDVDAHLNLGRAYERMGRLQAAEAEFQSAAAISSLSVRAHAWLGELYFFEKRYPEAAEQFSRSIEIVPTTKGYLGAGLAYWQMGRPDKAEAALKSAETLDPRSSRPHFVLGLFYGEHGKTDEAVREYQAGFKIDPGNQEARAAFQRLKVRDPATSPP